MPTAPVRTVAVIDDDRRVLMSLANLLASGGYGTRTYESALDFFPTATRVWYALSPTWECAPLTAFKCSIERFIRTQPRQS
jgi:hypothetical protein